MQTPNLANGKASSTSTTFSRSCTVSTSIQAKPETIWTILTNAAQYTKWNSTVISLEGRIAPDEKISLKSISDPKRTFNLKIAAFNPPHHMVWSDGAAPMFKGVRTYTLSAKGDGTTEFTMTEVISGLLLLMIGGTLPDFKPVFEQFAADLKREAEKVS